MTFCQGEGATKARALFQAALSISISGDSPVLKCSMWHGGTATLLLRATLLLFKSNSLGGTRSFHKYTYTLSKTENRTVLDPLGHRICSNKRQDSSQFVNWSLIYLSDRSTYPARLRRNMALKKKARVMPVSCWMKETSHQDHVAGSPNTRKDVSSKKPLSL